MIKNYFKTALRSLWKHKGISFINILGLGLATGISLLLILTASFELSFDNFHENKEELYRVFMEVQRVEGIDRGTVMPAPLRPSLEAELPHIVNSSRYMDHSSILEKDAIQFDLMTRAVDKEFLEMFSFELTSGNPAEALGDLSYIVLTEKTAERIFGDKDPMGEALTWKDGYSTRELIVNGICADPPKNSSIRFDALTRFETHEGYEENLASWDDQYHELYIQLAPGIEASALEEKLKPFVAQHYSGSIEQMESEGIEPQPGKELIALKLQPLSDRHENTLIAAKNEKNSLSYPYLFSGLAIFLLLVAAFNFVNLTIARYLSRAKEAGVRKVLGANRKQLLAQFWGEALLIGSIALIAGGIIFYDLIPTYNELFRRSIHLGQLQSPKLWLGILGGLFVVTLLAGAYPAWWLSRINMPEIFKGKVQLNTPGSVRNTLIIIQFAIASLLIACTLIAWRQIDFLRTKDLGFNKDQVISLPLGQGVESEKIIPLLRQKLASNPNILSLSATDDNLGRGLDGSQMTSVFGFIHEGKSLRTHGMEVEYDLLKTLDIELLEGRSFSRSYQTDSSRAILISKAMADQLGVENPLGVKLPLFDEGETPEVVGVFQDFHFESLHKPIEPLTLTLRKLWPLEYVFIKVSPQALTSTLSEIEQVWKELAPQSEFQASFLDENTDRLYQEEQRLSKIFLSASLLAIAISCLGLFAMALLAIQQRTREIGIRKVLGASVGSIVGLLSRQFVYMVLVSLLIALPFAWYGMGKWLEDFAYRTELTGWVFLLTGILAVGIALLTVSIHSFRAALTDPIEALKSGE